MNRREKGFGLVEVIMAVVIVALLGGVVYLYIQANGKKDPKPGSSMSSSSTSVSSKSAVATQTYTGDGFTLQYPKDWAFLAEGTKVNPSDPNDGGVGGDEFISIADRNKDDNSKILLLVTVKTSSSAQQYANDQHKNDSDMGVQILSSAGSKINGYSAQRVNVKNAYGAGYEVFVASNGTLVQFIYHPDGNVDTYESIIRSIKFN